MHSLHPYLHHWQLIALALIAYYTGAWYFEIYVPRSRKANMQLARFNGYDQSDYRWRLHPELVQANKERERAYRATEAERLARCRAGEIF